MLAYACSDTSLAILGIFSVCINELDVKVNSTLVTLADDKVGRVQQKSGQKKKNIYLQKLDTLLENTNEI